MTAFRNATGVMLCLLTGCATGGAPKPATTTQPTPATPATASPPAAPAGPRLTLRPVPFPPGTFTGEVSALSPPTVTARGDQLAIGLALGGSSPAECLLSRKELAAGGSIPNLVGSTRSGFRLQTESVTDVATRPPLPALFLTVHRLLGAVKVAAYRRGPELSLACVQNGPAPPESFEAVVAALAASLRPVTAPPRPAQIWSCQLRIDGGTTGWERTEIATTAAGSTLRSTAAIAYQHGDAVDLLEVDTREQSDAHGRVTSSITTRTLNGIVDLGTSLTHEGGATYRYAVGAPDAHFAGTFTTADPEGFIGTLAFTERIRAELLTGRAAELKLQTYDPFESPETPTTKTYRPEAPGSRKLLVTTASRQSYELVDDNGYSLGGEFELHDGNTLYETCAPERSTR